MKPISGYMIRKPTAEEVDTAASFVHEAVRFHRAQVRSRWPNGKTLKNHENEPEGLPPWVECTEEQKNLSRWPILQVVDAEGNWDTTGLNIAKTPCGCGVIGLVTMRVVLVEMGILPMHLPGPVPIVMQGATMHPPNQLDPNKS